jgi:hypothetical protein
MLSTVRRSQTVCCRSYRLSLWAGAIIGLLGCAVQSLSQTPDPEAALRQRMAGYWTAMQQADFAAASEYVDAESRATFRDRVPKAATGTWEIQKLQFNNERTHCDTVTVVQKPFPLYGETIAWPVQNEWVLVDGIWYMHVPWKAGDNPFLQVFKSQAETEVKRGPEPAPSIRAPEVPKDANQKMTEIVNRLTPSPDNPKVMHFGEKGTFRYAYRNSGTAPLKIQSVYADCHCTGVARDGYPEVAPGATGNIEVTLDTFGMPLGSIDKDIRVQFNDIQYPLVLHLSIANLPNFELAPLNIDLGSIQVGRPAEQHARIKNESGRLVKFLMILNSDPRLKVTIDKMALPAGEEAVVTFQYDTSKAGDVFDALTLRTDLEAEPLINIPVRGKVIP